MAKETDFAPNDVLPSQFENDQQEVDSPSAWGISLQKSSATSLTVAPAADGSTTGQSGIRINGVPRTITAPVSSGSGLSGRAAGTWDVYAVVAGSAIGAGFTLSFVAHGGSAPANSRKIGEVDWSGSAITALRNMVDAVSGHARAHSRSGIDPLLAGVSSPAAVGRAAGAPGTSDEFALADHVHPYNDGTGLQPGVVGAGDLALSAVAMPNPASGQITFTLAAGTYWILASGVLIPITLAAGTHTLTPTPPGRSLTGLYTAYIDSNGNVSLSSPQATSAGNQAVSAFASSDVNSIVSGSNRLTIATFAISENGAGTLFAWGGGSSAQGVGWIDRRPWARGALTWTTDDGSAGAITMANNTWTEIPKLALRLELGGLTMLRAQLSILLLNASEMLFGFGVDGGAAGNGVNARVWPSSNAFASVPAVPMWLTAGSHIFRVYAYGAAGSIPAAARHVVLMEDVRGLANNGTA